MGSLWAFIKESNAIEGFHRDPFEVEFSAARRFLQLPQVIVARLDMLQEAFAPGEPLRTRVGLDVQVGNYVAPRGGPHILERLTSILDGAHKPKSDPWKTHVAFEMLHPYCDGNGRTGRMLWAWHMARLGFDPFALPFLHRWYYQTLAAQED